MKKRLLAGMIAITTLAGISCSTNAKTDTEVYAETDTRIIVEVNKKVSELTKDEIIKSQNELMRKISKDVTSNFELVDRYSVLNNAFVLEVNSEDVESIRNLDGVASVTIDKIHAKEDLSDGSYYSANLTGRISRATTDTEGGEEFENISAKTMNKPSVSNEGEGTVIAILDNEFYLRGEHTPSGSDDGTPWHHVVFKPLADDVVQKFTFDNLTPIFANKENPTHAQRAKNAVAGQEGSLYYNNKVPFYYDYGGESLSYGKVGPMDYDVSSLLTYHGSHVASIASANADKYKGIAPNAQLACMKVFTTYIASETGEQMGFGTSTGAYDTAILSALEDAILLDVDGINMSLGSDLGDFDTESITMKTLRELASDKHILTAISAGNAGKSSFSFTGGYGNWTTEMVETGILGSYANSGDATIVASGQPLRVYYENAIKLLDSQGQGLKNVAFEDQIVNREGLEAEFPENNQHWMIKDIVGDDLSKKVEWQYIPGFGTSADYGELDITGKVAVVNRGSTSFADKYNIAAGKGAIGVIIINNDPTATDFNFRCSFGEDFNPSIPCALALYKDKPTFEQFNHGEFQFIQKDVSDNDLAKTISTFSSDGAKFNWDLKPDITTPGENIRGAVPPQKKEHREESPYSTYEYLSGTSMAAPNFAGVQSLILSKAAKGVYADGVATPEELEDLNEFRSTVDMRLMSTANPMKDASANPEDQTTSYTSPRMQGAGLVDLNKAYNTEIFLEGLDVEGNPIGKSKICLGNTEKIANGTLDLSFLAHNEGAEKTYTAKVTVMRPAIATVNNVIADCYHYTGELDDVSKIPGLTYYTEQFSPSQGQNIIVQKTNIADKVQNDVIKLTKQIEFYTTAQDYENKTNPVVLPQGYYYNSATTGCTWEPLPSFEAQSIQDVELFSFEQQVTIPAGTSKVSLPEYPIPQDVREDTLEKFNYGCAIEGYVELMESETRALSIPFLGFYSGADVDGQTLDDAPVVEPFEFEKDPTQIYPSDLVNDVTKQLVGKDNCEFGSLWTVGYAESTIDIDTDKVLTNDANFLQMSGFHKVGLNPADDEYFDNPKENIYVGNPLTSNTMIIQQFVMRSVKDNFFTIKNQAGEVVYKNVLSDLLFSDNNELYKSHVDANYLGAGYVAHRAYAAIPLYDVQTNKPFADGKYEIEFNYQLAYDGAWVSKAYNFTIDSTAPWINSIKEYVDTNGTSRVRIDITDEKIAAASIGYRVVDVHYDTENKVYYLDETKQFIQDQIEMLGTLSNGQKRLTVKITDAAYGESSAIIHFFGSTFSNYVMAQGSGLATNQDFIKVGKEIVWYTLNFGGGETEFEQNTFVTIITNIDTWEDPVGPVDPVDPDPTPSKKGCKNSIIAASGIITLVGLAGVSLLLKKKHEEEK